MPKKGRHQGEKMGVGERGKRAPQKKTTKTEEEGLAVVTSL